MQHGNWKCPKCGSGTFEVSDVRTSGGALASIFDIENRKFSAVTCERCSYTELYRTDPGGIEKVLDFFTT